MKKKNIEQRLKIGKKELLKVEKKIEEKILNVPNTITLLRVIGTPLLVYILLSDYSKWFKAAAFVIFALSDMLDGHIARKYNQTTNFGAKFDMLADRLFFSAVIVTIAIKLFLINDSSLSSPWIFLIVLSREIVTFPIAAYMFFNKTPFVKAKWTGKVTTFMQGVAITAFLISLPGTIIILSLTGILGIIAGLNYWKDSFEKLA